MSAFETLKKTASAGVEGLFKGANNGPFGKPDLPHAPVPHSLLTPPIPSSALAKAGAAGVEGLFKGTSNGPLDRPNLPHSPVPHSPWAPRTLGSAFVKAGAVEGSLSSSSSSSSSTDASAPPNTCYGSGAPHRSTDQILKNYQVREDQMIDWSPWGPAGWFVNSKKMTKTEGGLLDRLQFDQGILGLSSFKDARDDAFAVSEKQYTGVKVGAEDGHQDAFRHIYWNVLLSRKFGDNFATAFATAHEGVPGNPADREAMDLYNNELGRKIARENPDASEKELQAIIQKEIECGQAVVINNKGELVFSNEAEVGKTGTADDAPVGGGIVPPEWTKSY